MNNNEQVLVVERSVFEGVGAFQGISFAVDRFLDALFSPGALRFIPRAWAEDDPTYKQIIPYVLMTDGERYVSYVRGKRAGEQRLVGRRSIGIGGHINPNDDLPLFDSGYRRAYQAAVEREVAEEIVLEGTHTDRVVALLNDDSTAVGRVHLGIVHYWTVHRLNIRKREQVITQLALLNRTDLREVRDTLESWSQVCVDNLDALARSGASLSPATAPAET
jgi:predicted NUDIX family phosphoesterase